MGIDRLQKILGHQSPTTTSVYLQYSVADLHEDYDKAHLMQHPESCCADVFAALRENLRRINRLRVDTGERPIRGCTYNSFAKYWHWFKLLGLIEPVDRREPAIYSFLEERQFYRISSKGEVEEEGWADPLGRAHPEFR